MSANHPPTGLNASGENGADQDQPAGGPAGPQPMPLDTESLQFTLRAVLTGMVLAAILSACNIYTGLKIGWSLNMSITAGVLAFAFWKIWEVFGSRRFTMLECNINQTACSSGAAVSSAGLVAPIPALAMMTGYTPDWHYLALWVFSVCLVGITVAIVLRKQMLITEKLPFANGIATAQTLREIYSHGREALSRVKMLISAACMAALVKAFHAVAPFKFWLASLPGLNWMGGLTDKIALPAGLSAWLQLNWLKGFSPKALTFQFDANLLMYGVGGLVGLRATISMVIGAIFAWGYLAPMLIHSGDLRLHATTPLAILPAEVELELPPTGYTFYDGNRRRLRHEGVMTDEERAHLLAKSENLFYQEAVQRLYHMSRFEATADELAEAAYTTSAPLQRSVALNVMPRGFQFGSTYGGRVRYDRGRRALIAMAALPAEALQRFEQRLADHQAANPSLQEQCDALRAALVALAAVEWDAPSLEGLPDELRSRVELISEARVLRVRGPLSADDADILTDLVDAQQPFTADWAATVAAVRNSSRLSAAQPEFGSVVNWLLWPGVTLMVVASLTSFLFSGRAILNSFSFKQDAAAQAADREGVTARWFVSALIGALLLSVVLQVSLFAIIWWAAVAGVLLTFVLAIVAARVSGETNITPVGAMGKVTQLLFGVMVPGQPAANLMSANVTGGAASQCADLLHDLKCGWLIGASPRWQTLAQVFGAFAGAMVGSAVYLVLVPNPGEQLMTDEWAAPAVATWKAVAELFNVGFDAIPSGTPLAMLYAAMIAVVMAGIERFAPKRIRPYTLSPSSIGLAFVIHAHISMTMLVGALAGFLLGLVFKNWTVRFFVTLCAGLIAGESLMGVGIAIGEVISGS